MYILFFQSTTQIHVFNNHISLFIVHQLCAVYVQKISLHLSLLRYELGSGTYYFHISFLQHLELGIKIVTSEQHKSRSKCMCCDLLLEVSSSDPWIQASFHFLRNYTNHLTGLTNRKSLEIP